jgi:hypothetical protein
VPSTVFIFQAVQNSYKNVPAFGKESANKSETFEVQKLDDFCLTGSNLMDSVHKQKK